MALVEKAAAYLDGPGRLECRGLAPQISVLYATESMRLTTRLLDLASWLLIRRALKAREITSEEAQKRRERVKLQTVGRPGHTAGFDDLPDGLRTLVHQSFALHDRIVQLDRAMSTTLRTSLTESAPTNPVAAQWLKLEQAFMTSQRVH
jgi:regulator of CtrA degradation